MYSPSCLSESCRPNQVFHQNRNGMSTISQPVAKNNRRLRVDMRGLAGGGDEAGSSVTVDVSGESGATDIALYRVEIYQIVLNSASVDYVRIQDSLLLQIMRDRVLG